MPQHPPRFHLPQTPTFHLAGTLAEDLGALLKKRLHRDFRVLSVWDQAAITAMPAKARVKLYYFPAKTTKPFALICPGGAYAHVARLHEGFPTAIALSQAGHPAFVLVYRTGLHARHPAPLDDLAQALQLIHQKTGVLQLSNLNYAIWGFSAGAHLALSWGTDHLGAKNYQLPAPTAIIAAYPVVNMGEYTHALSQRLLLGRHPTDQEIVEHSIEQQISTHYPPTYVWHCTEDPVVSIANSDRLVEALDLAGVPCQYKVVQGAAHGWGVAHGTAAEGWVEEALAFWDRHPGKG